MKLRRRTKRKVLLAGLVLTIIFIITVAGVSAGSPGRGWGFWWPFW
ncbi:MAG: hypothetical protein ACM3XM_14970 [Mycobacterium leprae]